MNTFVFGAFTLAAAAFAFAVSADTKIKKLEKRIEELERNKWLYYLTGFWSDIIIALFSFSVHIVQ